MKKLSKKRRTIGQGIEELWQREVGETSPRAFAHRVGASQVLSQTPSSLLLSLSILDDCIGSLPSIESLQNPTPPQFRTDVELNILFLFLTFLHD